MKLLTLLLLTPLCGSLLIAFLPQHWGSHSRPLALIFSAITLLFACLLVGQFDPTLSGVQLLENGFWNLQAGGTYLVGVDGLSLPLVLLAATLSFVAMLASHTIEERQKGYYVAMLLLEMAMLGVFIAQNWLLFYIFWELTLIPLFLLVDRWGGEKRQHAALNFVLYTLGGSVFMLLSLLLAFDASHGFTFAMDEMAISLRQTPHATQVWIFLGLLMGFGVKMPIFPMHGWLPLAHVQAPSPVSMLLSGVLLKMGSYGLMRAAILAPHGMATLAHILGILALVSLLYGGLLAWRQTDLKKMVAYSSVSHMGIVLLGLATLTPAGITGAVSQMVAHGLAAAALFMLAGMLYHRTHSREIAYYGDLARLSPRFAFFIILAFLTTIGLPTTAGFIAELHTIIGTYQRWGWPVILTAIAMLITASYAFRTTARMLTPSPQPNPVIVKDMSGFELATLAIPVLLTFLLGLFPSPLLKIMESSVRDFIKIFDTLG
ncbi:MAG: NADH-quinone oxidoreductase subunit M [Magnetococcales bacterium]|nr:NADH-quinone oxidoreductase subunit M [Magnetococcales bacterium]NGZ28479.1 NADH-quinone oxidoreductase subunit M [Magnetococcales bacterium]